MVIGGRVVRETADQLIGHRELPGPVVAAPPGLPSSEIASRIVAVGASIADGAGLRAAMGRKALGGTMDHVLADPALTDAALEAVRRYLASPALARNWWTNAIAMLPSPTAAAARLTGLQRTSPQAKMPGTLVSSR